MAGFYKCPQCKSNDGYYVQAVDEYTDDDEPLLKITVVRCALCGIEWDADFEWLDEETDIDY